MGKKIAIIATNGFEFSELTKPRDELINAGHIVHVIAPEGDTIQGKSEEESVPVDKLLSEVDPADYDALVLPGGVYNPDALRTNDEAVAFVAHHVTAGKPIAAICHGPWTLINALGVEGKHLTSWPSLRADLENAGAIWIDNEVVVDGNLVTSRNPDDIPAFNTAFLEMVGTDTEQNVLVA